MRVAINLVEQGEAPPASPPATPARCSPPRASCSAWCPGIDRPAIVSALPVVGRPHGDARPRCQPRLQRRSPGAVRGDGLGDRVRPARHRASRASGLLNVGEEDIKGTEEIKAAHKRLHRLGAQLRAASSKATRSSPATSTSSSPTASPATWPLKAMEGLAKFISGAMKEEFTAQHRCARSSALAAAPTLKALKARLDPRVYNGASMVGIERRGHQEPRRRRPRVVRQCRAGRGHGSTQRRARADRRVAREGRLTGNDPLIGLGPPQPPVAGRQRRDTAAHRFALPAPCYSALLTSAE